MQRKTRLSRRTNPKKKMSRLQVFDKKVHRFVHELGHDLGELGEDVHGFLDKLEDKLEGAGHSYEKVVKILKSNKNYADYSFMMSRDPIRRKETIKDLEHWIHQNVPNAKIHWGKERGVAYAWENKTPFQDFRISNVSLSDILLISSLLSMKGVGGFKT